MDRSTKLIEHMGAFFNVMKPTFMIKMQCQEHTNSLKQQVVEGKEGLWSLIVETWLFFVYWEYKLKCRESGLRPREIRWFFFFLVIFQTLSLGTRKLFWARIKILVFYLKKTLSPKRFHPRKHVVWVPANLKSWMVFLLSPHLWTPLLRYSPTSTVSSSSTVMASAAAS
jgi:hypothetical protein